MIKKANFVALKKVSIIFFTIVAFRPIKKCRPNIFHVVFHKIKVKINKKEMISSRFRFILLAVNKKRRYINFF